ncbi:sialidase family protein, partial [Streptomyces sp. SID337]
MTVETSVPFRAGREGYASFRIPAVVTSAAGTVLAFCEGRVGSQADFGNIDIVLKRSADGGRTWGPLQ